MASKREIDWMPEQWPEKMFLLPKSKWNSEDNGAIEKVKTWKDSDLSLLGRHKPKKVVEDTKDEVDKIQWTWKDWSADHKDILEL